MGSLRSLREEPGPEKFERSVIRWVTNLGYKILARRGGKRTYLRVSKEGEDVLIFLRNNGHFSMYYARTKNPDWDKKKRREGSIDRIDIERALREVVEEGRIAIQERNRCTWQKSTPR